MVNVALNGIIPTSKMKIKILGSILATFALLISIAACSSAENAITVHTIRYGQNNLKADIYEQNNEPQNVRKPAVLLIHGGGWGGGSRTEFKELAKSLAQEGAVSVAIDYRLTSNGAHWPAQARDVEEAVWWIRENAGSLHVDPERVVAIGGSAGGHLAAWLGTTDQRNANGTPSRVNLVVSIWGPWDLTVSNIRQDAKNMISALIGNQSPQLASPLAYINSQSAPALLIHGTKDDLVPPDQSIRACDALRAANVRCELMLLEGVNHRFTNAEDTTKVVMRVKDFIARH